MLGQYGTFRGCLSPDWMIPSPGPMTRQRSGTFSASLRAHGVKGIVIGDVTEEWYLYSIAHPISSPKDILPNLNRYFPDVVSRKLFDKIKRSARFKDREGSVAERLFGEVLSTGQVYLPGRILARDLLASGFPVLRYEIRWTPEEVRPLGKIVFVVSSDLKLNFSNNSGYVTHGTDRCLWALRKPDLNPKQWEVANQWVDVVQQELNKVLEAGNSHTFNQVLTLREDQTISWTIDRLWGELMDLVNILPGEWKATSSL